MPIQLTPLVLSIDRPTTLTIEHLTPRARYILHVRCRRQLDLVAECELTADNQGCLHVEGTYTGRGEYTVDLYASSIGRSVSAVDRLARLHFFVAPPDLFVRRPLRCDFHIHTTYSDGRNTPAEMVIRGRELGLDVAVITDHNYYASSIEAVAETERLNLNLITMPGEEVSAPDWHILSINADTGIYDLALKALDLEGKDNRSGQRASAREALLSDYEALRWAVQAVQAHGGRAYLAHPYWAISRGFHLPTAAYDRILEESILDGLELLGDVRHENNVRSLARYLDFRAAGHDLPILGNSDTHRAEHTYGTYWTLVFAKPPSQESAIPPQEVLDAIAGGWSVACTTAQSETAGVAGRAAHAARAAHMLAFGPFEWVDYAYFLEQHFFPMHGVLCAEEASLAYRAWRGDTLPDGAMAACKAKMEALYARCWSQRTPVNG